MTTPTIVQATRSYGRRRHRRVRSARPTRSSASAFALRQAHLPTILATPVASAARHAVTGRALTRTRDRPNPADRVCAYSEQTSAKLALSLPDINDSNLVLIATARLDLSIPLCALLSPALLSDLGRPSSVAREPPQSVEFGAISACLSITHTHALTHAARPSSS